VFQVPVIGVTIKHGGNARMNGPEDSEVGVISLRELACIQGPVRLEVKVTEGLGETLYAERGFPVAEDLICLKGVEGKGNGWKDGRV
jgi:hypothetical protein